MAETTYQGVIAGIGDKENGINVIEPHFDARIRKFVVGSDGIIDGFNISGNKLVSGACIAKGYVGLYDGQPIEIPAGYKIYGKFQIFHDNSIPDRFFVVVADGELTQQDDVLHEAGIFYLPLTSDNRLKYPINAYHADKVTTVVADGVPSGGTNLENGVTAVTPPLDDNSNKVATTEFVQNLWSAYIDSNAADDTNSNLRFIVKRKSKYCIVELLQTVETHFDSAALTLIGQLPDGFYPKSEINIVGSASGMEVEFSKFKIDTNGNVYALIIKKTSTSNGQAVVRNIGYETN